jgi:hypothetical protein
VNSEDIEGAVMEGEDAIVGIVVKLRITLSEM